MNAPPPPNPVSAAMELLMASGRSREESAEMLDSLRTEGDPEDYIKVRGREVSYDRATGKYSIRQQESFEDTYLNVMSGGFDA